MGVCVAKLAGSALVAMATLGFGSAADAATLQVDAAGKLAGATGVDVDGQLLDVTFSTGSCVEQFSGCNEPSDFYFTTLISASRASRALLDQVFVNDALGSFDDDPGLTATCSSSSESCRVATPYLISPFNVSNVRVAYAENVELHFNPQRAQDDVNQTEYPITQVGGTPFTGPYAVWRMSVVPEPSMALCFGIGLAILASRGVASGNQSS